MPGGDGTGPMGMGPMTGRGAGCCAGYVVPGFPGCVGIGLGRRMGGGRGFRRMFYSTGYPGWAANSYIEPSQNGQAYDEMTVLKKQEELLEAQLKQVKNRLKGFDEEK